VELAYYSDYAVRLVNSEDPARGKDTLTSVEAVRDLFGGYGTGARRATDADVTRFRSVRARLRSVFEAADEYKEIAKSELAAGKVQASFAVADGSLFLRTDGSLLRIGSK
jgi:hypothetical protein